MAPRGKPRRYEVQSSLGGAAWRRRISYARREKAKTRVDACRLYESGLQWRVFDNETGRVVE